jgi:hypothetical protein
MSLAINNIVSLLPIAAIGYEHRLCLGKLGLVVGCLSLG